MLGCILVWSREVCGRTCTLAARCTYDTAQACTTWCRYMYPARPPCFTQVNDAARALTVFQLCQVQHAWTTLVIVLGQLYDSSAWAGGIRLHQTSRPPCKYACIAISDHSWIVGNLTHCIFVVLSEERLLTAITHRAYRKTAGIIVTALQCVHHGNHLAVTGQQWCSAYGLQCTWRFMAF